MASVLSEIITSELKCYISVYSIWPVAKTQPASLLATCCPPTPSSEWSGWTFLVCAVNRNCAFIIHIMNHARKRAAQCWDWSLCVCVWGKEWGVWGTKAKKGDTMPPFNLGPFFQVPVGCICHVLLSCHHSPPAPEIPEHFLKPSSVLLHFLGLPPFRWPHPLCSTTERKPKKHCSSNSLSQTQPSVLHPPSSCSSVLHLELVSPSLAHTHNIWETSCIIQI